MLALGITFEAHGYGSEAKEREFAGHVCASFYPQKGMMIRTTGPQALIELPVDLVLVEGTFFVPGNTARNEYSFAESSAWTAAEDFDDLFEEPTGWRLKDWQAEVWIPDGIAVADFRRVLFARQAALEAAFSSVRDLALTREVPLTFELGTWHFPREPELEQ